MHASQFKVATTHHKQVKLAYFDLKCSDFVKWVRVHIWNDSLGGVDVHSLVSFSNRKSHVVHMLWWFISLFRFSLRFLSSRVLTICGALVPNAWTTYPCEVLSISTCCFLGLRIFWQSILLWQQTCLPYSINIYLFSIITLPWSISILNFAICNLLTEKTDC